MWSVITYLNGELAGGGVVLNPGHVLNRLIRWHAQAVYHIVITKLELGELDENPPIVPVDDVI